MRKLLEKINPFASFRDCSIGSKEQRWAAYKYNQEMKDLLLPALFNWFAFGVICLISLFVIELIKKHVIPIDLIATVSGLFLGIGAAVSFIVFTIVFVAWIYLTLVKNYNW